MIKIDETKVSIRSAYRLVVDEMPSRLEGAVNGLMAEGYLPCGNLVVDGDMLIQPMIKTDIEELK